MPTFCLVRPHSAALFCSVSRPLLSPLSVVQPVLSISPALQPLSAGALPRVGDVVLGRVLRVTPRLALLDVACVGSVPAAPRVSGVVRLQDVRSTPGEVSLGECFRRTDVVRARVLSLGDARSYFLSTAEPDLGVVSARSESGFPLRPVSWREMRCERTGALEPRKVAKPKGANVVVVASKQNKH